MWKKKSASVKMCLLCFLFDENNSKQWNIYITPDCVKFPKTHERHWLSCTRGLIWIFFGSTQKTFIWTKLQTKQRNPGLILVKRSRLKMCENSMSFWHCILCILSYTPKPSSSWFSFTRITGGKPQKRKSNKYMSHDMRTEHRVKLERIVTIKRTEDVLM